MSAAQWAMLLTLSLLWGGSFFFGKVALAELPPFTVVFARVSVAAGALLLIVRAQGLRMPGRLAEWGPYFAMGALNNLIPFSLIFWGQTRIASGLASILNATTPLFTVVLAHLLTRDERLTAPRLAGVLAGVSGVAVMIGPGALAGLGAELAAQGAVLAAALSYACAGIYGRRFGGRPPLVTAAGQVTATTCLMLPVVLLADRPWTLAAPGAATWGSLLALALLCTAVAYLLYFRLLATAGATNLLLVTFLIPVSAIALGAVFLGERLAAHQFGGMALIALGLAAIDGRPLGWARRRARPAIAPRA